MLPVVRSADSDLIREALLAVEIKDSMKLRPIIVLGAIGRKQANKQKIRKLGNQITIPDNYLHIIVHWII